MQALRQRAACAVRRVRPTTATTAKPRNVRTYASGHDAHHHHAEPEGVAEPLGPSFWVFALTVPAVGLAWLATRPGADGTPPRVTAWLHNFDYFAEQNAARNAARADMWERVAHDKHLFLNSETVDRSFELKTPELLGVMCPTNVPAGHVGDISRVTEIYREKYHKSEEAKAKRMAAKAAKAAESQS